MTDIITPAQPRVAAPRTPTAELARVEARRMLRHPAPWLGLLLAAWWVTGVPDTWATARYHGLLASLAPIFLGISMAAVTAFGREGSSLGEDAPLASERRALARLAACLPLVGVVGLVVAAGATYLRVTGGVRLGDEPGLTLHAHYSLPELLQPVLLAGFAAALGAAVVHVVRSQLASHVLLFVSWFLVGGISWMFQGEVVRMLTPVQLQPHPFEVAPAEADPTTLPADWLLSAPGEYQDHWARIVVSPELAVWHDVYLVALTALLVATATPGRLRRPILLVGGLLAAVAVALQLLVAP